MTSATFPHQNDALRQEEKAIDIVDFLRDTSRRQQGLFYQGSLFLKGALSWTQKP